MNVQEKFNDALEKHENLLAKNSEYRELSAKCSEMYRQLEQMLDAEACKLLFSFVELREELNGISDFIFFEQGVNAGSKE